MRNAKVLIPLGLLAMMTACGPVEWLNPGYDAGDVTFDSALLGRWHNRDGSIMQFQNAGDKTYQMVYTEMRADGTSEESRYDAHLVKLGDVLFLDVLPQPTSANPGAYAFSLPPSGDDGLPPHLTEVGDGLYAAFAPAPQASAGSEEGAYELQLIQGHWLLRIWLEGDTLRLADLDEDWLKEAINQGKVDIGHEVINDTLVFTAPTPDLRAFLEQNADDPGAFPEPEDAWSRQE